MVGERFALDVDLTGMTCIVTGSTRGIGLALATGLGSAGAQVVVSSRKPSDCEAVASKLLGTGIKALAVPAHLGDVNAAADLVSRCVETFGGVDVIVNNAATGLAQAIGEFTVEAWEKSLAVNLRGPTFLIERALPYLKNSPWPSVVNVVSPGAFHPAPEWSMYAAAKAALVSLTRSYAAALGQHGVRVNALCPGPISTDLFRSNSEAEQRRIAASRALRRVGRPEEMLGPVLFLVSRAASYVTGSVLFADGGLYQ